ncbi:MAG: DUF4203 domain-containing protein [Anaerolineales bacterium]
MTFELFCVTLIALAFGVAVAFRGYRFFLVLLPILGFVFGFALGVQTLQAIFDVGFLTTVTSWVVGFLVGLLFGVLSYLFYIVGVALLSFALGYAVGVGLMGLIGFDLGLIAWLVGMAAGVALALLVVFFNVQKWVIVVITGAFGSGVIVGSLLLVLGRVTIEDIGTNAVGQAIQDSFLWLVLYLVIAVLGIAAQIGVSQAVELEPPESTFLSG